MKFGRIVPHTSMHRLWSQIFDLTSHFQDGGHDVISGRKVLPPGLRLPIAYAEASVICIGFAHALLKFAVAVNCRIERVLNGGTETGVSDVRGTEF